MKKVALFIDFDNIYSGLHRVAPQAADAFATDPASWLRWLETGMPVEETPVDCEPRRILVRRCYLNPRVYQKFRAYFVLAGFDVVDCPPLTQQGKTSADIRMAMDVLDMLGHQTCFEEFVILSGDADFTPVLLRLRAHDRRTVILAVGFAAQAYKAACDMVINEGTFIETALGISGEEQPGPLDFDEDGEVPRSEPTLTGAPAHPLDSIARDLALAATRGPVPSADLPSIYRRQPAFRASNDWLGFGSLRAMTEAVVARRGELSMSPGNPWMISLRADGSRAAGIRPPSIRSIRSGTTPVPASPAVPGMLERLARRISQVTGAPLLPPTTYAAVFRAAAEYLSSNEFNLYSASKEVVKLTAAQGVEVSRTSVVFILRGVAYGGADLGRAPASYSASDLAQSFRDNLSTLCTDRGLVLSETESQALDRWLVKRLDIRASVPPGSAPVPTPPVPTSVSRIVPEAEESEPA
jgi:hypothetical protein